MDATDPYERAMKAIEQAITAVRHAKPADRPALRRCIAVTVTMLEQAGAYYFLYVLHSERVTQPAGGDRASQRQGGDRIGQYPTPYYNAGRASPYAYPHQNTRIIFMKNTKKAKRWKRCT